MELQRISSPLPVSTPDPRTETSQAVIDVIERQGSEASMRNESSLSQQTFLWPAKHEAPI